MQPALAGIAVGTGAFALLLGPAVLVQRRAYGRVHLSRLAVIAALCVYVAALLAYTVVPDDAMAALCASRSGGKLRLVPLHSLREAIAAWGGDAGSAPASWSAWQLAMNVLLFVPLGVFARSLFGRGIGAATGIGLLVSLACEATQYTGFWGLYSCGIRVADVDDVLTNTLGTALGALLGPLLLGSWLPRARDLKRRMRERIGLPPDDPAGR